MTRKDYILIAAAIAKARAVCGTDFAADREAVAIHRTANYIADAMARDNPAFDRARFLKACGVAS